MRTEPTLCSIGLTAALAVAAAAPAISAPSTKTLEQSIPATGRLVIENVAGAITLEAGSGDRVTVVATVYAEGSSSAETARLLDAMRWVERRGVWGLSYPVDDYRGFAYPEGVDSWGSSTNSEYMGERVRVYGSARRGAPVLYADLAITVPDGARLRVENIAGPVSGGGLSGELEVDTGRGDVGIARFDGRLDVDTGSGHVELEAIRGDLRVDTGSGEVEVEDVDVRELDVDTGSGDVLVRRGSARRARVDTGSGDIELRGVEVEDFDGDTGSGDVVLEGDLAGARSIVVDTGSGDVDVLAGPSFDFDLRADLGSGSVRVRYDDATLKRRDRRVVGAVRGAGTTRIDIDTGSGNCTVSPAGG